MDVGDLKRQILEVYASLDSYLDTGFVEDRLCVTPDLSHWSRAFFFTQYLAGYGLLLYCRDETDDQSVRICRREDHCCTKVGAAPPHLWPSLADAFHYAKRASHFVADKILPMLMPRIPAHRLLDASSWEYQGVDIREGRQCHHLKALGCSIDRSPQEIDLWVSVEDLTIRLIKEHYLFDPYSFIDVNLSHNRGPIKAQFERLDAELTQSADLMLEIPWLLELAAEVKQAIRPMPMVRTTWFQDVFLNRQDLTVPLYVNFAEVVHQADRFEAQELCNRWQAA